MRRDFYKHSGAVPIRAIFMATAATLVVGAVAGALYGLAIWYNPLIYVSAVLSLGFGGGMGFLAGKTLKAGHARNTAVCIAFGVAAAGYAHLIGWLTWTAIAFSDVDEFEWVYLLDPEAFWEGIVAINEVGVWSLRSSSPVNGAMLWAVWGIEAAFVLGAAAFGASVPATDGVYCEHCHRWCTDEEGVMRVADDEASEPLKKRVQDGDLRALAEISAPGEEAATWLAVGLSECRGCRRTNTFTLDRVTRSFDKDGNEKLAEETLVDRWLVSREQAEEVREIAARALERPSEEEEIAEAS